MENDVTKKFYELLRKCQSWADDEKYIPTPFRQPSQYDLFYQKITHLLTDEMIAQKCFFGTEQIHLPSRFMVQISEDDNQNFQGEKRQLLIQSLNRFLVGEFRRLGVEPFERELVELEVLAAFQPGEIKITSFWRESFSPEIRFNQDPQHLGAVDFDESAGNTIIAPSFWTDESDGAENETMVRSNLKRYFSLEIWRAGNYQNKVPVFQPEITIGRSVREQIRLQGDNSISRHHLDLTYQANNKFILSVAGQNPVFIRDVPLFTGQNLSCFLGDFVKIGSYCLQIQE
jgi:hypothetical protein